MQLPRDTHTTCSRRIKIIQKLAQEYLFEECTVCYKRLADLEETITIYQNALIDHQALVTRRDELKSKLARYENGLQMLSNYASPPKITAQHIDHLEKEVSKIVCHEHDQDILDRQAAKDKLDQWLLEKIKSQNWNISDLARRSGLKPSYLRDVFNINKRSFASKNLYLAIAKVIEVTCSGGDLEVFHALLTSYLDKSPTSKRILPTNKRSSKTLPDFEKWSQSAEDIKNLSIRSEHARTRERFLALYMIGTAQKRADQWAKIIKRKTETVVNWIYDYNERGPDGVIYHPPETGREHGK